MKKSGLIIVLLLTPQVAFAHLVSTRFGEFYSGLLHPLSGLTHLVPWLALGLLGGLQGRDTARWALVTFPVAVSIGAVIGSWFPGWEFFSTLNLLSFAAVGILVALALTLNLSIFIGIIVLFGISHGYANAAAGLQAQDLLLYICGVVTAAYLLITLMTAIVHILVQRQQWGTIAVRAVGSWIVAVGVLYSGFTLFVPSSV